MQEHVQVEALGIRSVNGVDSADHNTLENTGVAFNGNAPSSAVECFAWFVPSVI